MPKITLENGKEIIISQESYDAMCKAAQESLSYKKIMEKLNAHYFITGAGNVLEQFTPGTESNNAKTEEQLESLLCLNMWLNVAEYLNGEQKPDWNNLSVDKYIVVYNCTAGCLDVSTNQFFKRCIGPWFKSRELARKSIEILGEETCKKALGIY